MNPVNVICASCGRDVVIELEVMELDEVSCYYCADYLFEHDLYVEGDVPDESSKC